MVDYHEQDAEQLPCVQARLGVMNIEVFGLDLQRQRRE